MDKDDLNKYCAYARKNGATSAKIISPGTVVTAPWVRMKCRFGCDGYGRSYCCPPHSPDAEETRKILDSYQRALLLHIETLPSAGRGKLLKKYRHSLIDLEGEIFRDGYYKALVFLAGPCDLCRRCGVIDGTPCADRYRARPSMEACGIDVFQTARNNGFHIQTLRKETEPRNTFCLLLID